MSLSGKSRCWEPGARAGAGDEEHSWSLATGEKRPSLHPGGNQTCHLPAHKGSPLGFGIDGGPRGCVWEMRLPHPSQPPRGPDLVLGVGGGSVGDPCCPNPRPGSHGEPPASPHKCGSAPRFPCGLGSKRPHAPDLWDPPPTQQAPRTPETRCTGCPGSDLVRASGLWTLISCPASAHMTPPRQGPQGSRHPRRLTHTSPCFLPYQGA